MEDYQQDGNDGQHRCQFSRLTVRTSREAVELFDSLQFPPEFPPPQLTYGHQRARKCNIRNRQPAEIYQHVNGLGGELCAVQLDVVHVVDDIQAARNEK